MLTYDSLQDSPADYIPAFDKALKEIVQAMDTSPELQQALASTGRVLEDATFYVGFEGSFGENFLSPRFVTARHLNQLICLEGIVTRCEYRYRVIPVYNFTRHIILKINCIYLLGSLVRPKVAKSVHYCEKTQLFTTREYRDGTGLSQALPTSSIYPKTVCFV
jgi:DNA replication licensing factor MCM3